MKKIFSLLGLSMLLLIGGCKPETPNDETKEKNHQDTHSLEVVFTPGTMEGDKFVADKNGKVLKFSAGVDTKWIQSNKVEPLPNVQYFVEIRHYSAGGSLINGELATNGEDKIHQHFFVPMDTGDLPISQIIDYRYLDTDPWDAPMTTDSKVIGKENPLGLKGVMTFKTPGMSLGIRLRLMHGRATKWNSKGEVSPFYKPGVWTANAQYDVDFKFNVEVLTNNN